MKTRRLSWVLKHRKGSVNGWSDGTPRTRTHTVRAPRQKTLSYWMKVLLQDQAPSLRRIPRFGGLHPGVTHQSLPRHKKRLVPRSWLSGLPRPVASEPSPVGGGRSRAGSTATLARPFPARGTHMFISHREPEGPGSSCCRAQTLASCSLWLWTDTGGAGRTLARETTAPFVRGPCPASWAWGCILDQFWDAHEARQGLGVRGRAGSGC